MKNACKFYFAFFNSIVWHLIIMFLLSSWKVLAQYKVNVFVLIIVFAMLSANDLLKLVN